MYNESKTRGQSESYGQNYQKLGKELMSIDELAVLDGSKCILQLRCVSPFLSRKYDITKHKNYKYLADYDKKNTLKIESVINTKALVKPDDVFDYYDDLEIDWPDDEPPDLEAVTG
jgi:type IV secretion system protein VirD4